MPSIAVKVVVEVVEEWLRAAEEVIHIIGIVTMLYASSNYWKQPYHTSALSGLAWVNELKNGHPRRIRTEIGVHLHVYLILVYELRFFCGLEDARDVTLDEQLAIFLYMSVTGLDVEHTGERFQRSNETISKFV